VNECLSVRERLTEYAVSALSSEDRAEVEQHLSWCAGCRKEASELRGGAALVGLSLPPIEPPAGLEDRVAGVVRSATAKADPRRRGRRRIRTATLLAAIVALMALAGGLIARQQTTERNYEAAQQQAQRFATQLDKLLRAFPGTQSTRPRAIGRAILAPSGDATGGGGALRVVSPHFEDLAVVIVGALPQRGAPYRAWLVTTSGRRLPMGKVAVDSSGGGQVVREFSADLRLYHYVQVRDAKGRLVLAGAFASP
jgi:hypothetical protein